MILRRIIFALCILTTSASLEAGIWDKIKNVFVATDEVEPPTIRVLLMHDVPYADVAVKGTYNLFDPYLNQRIATRFSAKGNRVQSIPAGIKWEEEFPGVYQIALVPDDKSIVTTINGHDYMGTIIIYDIGGAISVVNEVEIEDYLASTLPNKIRKPCQDEALAAAAIAERTYALHVSQNSENPYWHVRAEDVGYYGMDSVASDLRIESALNTTKYMVMSKTGVYEGVVTPYPVYLISGTFDPNYKMAKMSIDDIEIMAKQGDNAARILTKSLPDASIELMVKPSKK